MLKTLRRAVLAGLALAGVAIVSQPARAMPMVDLSPAVAVHATAAAALEKARIVCGYNGCFHRPNGFGFYHRRFGYYHRPHYGFYRPRPFFNPYHHRRYGFYRPYHHFHRRFY